MPLHDDRKLFEFLVLEVFPGRFVVANRVAQAAKLSRGVRRVRLSTRSPNFDARDLKRLAADAGIIRNRAKIEAAVNNAQRLIEVRKEFGTFAKYMWSWVDGKPIDSRMRSMKDIKPFDRNRRALVERPEETRLQIHGADRRLRPHASGGHGERPRGRLLPLPRTEENRPQQLTTAS